MVGLGFLLSKIASKVLQAGTVRLNTKQTGKVLVAAVHRFSDSQGEHFVQKWKKVLPGARSRFAVKREMFSAQSTWLHVTGEGGGQLPVENRKTCAPPGNR